MTPGNRVFETFYTPHIMKFIFWLGCVIIFIAAFWIAASAFSDGGVGSRSQNSRGGFLWLALFYWIFGTMLWRITCELIIVIFCIHDRLVSIDEKSNGAEQDAG